MNQQLFANLTRGIVLAAAVADASALTLTILPASAAKLSALANGDTALLYLTKAGSADAETTYEVVRASAINAATGVITLTARGVEGTAQAWAVGDKCECRLTAGFLNTLAAPTPRILLTSALDDGSYPNITPAGIIMPGIGGSFPAAPTSQTIARFDTAANTLPAGLSADDTSDPIYNTSAVRINLVQSGSRVMFPKLASNFSAVSVDCTGKNVVFTMKFIPAANLNTEQANVGTCRIRLYADSTPAAPSANYMHTSFGTSYVGDTMTGNWQKFHIPIEYFTVGTGATITDTAAFIQSIRYAAVEMQHAGVTSATFGVLLGTVAVEPKTLTKGLLILGFDDCRLDTFTYAAAKLAQYGFPGVLYPGALVNNMGKDPTCMTLTQVKRLQDVLGWQVAAQAFDTESPTDTADGLTAKLAALHNYYRQCGLWGSADGSFFSNISPGHAVYQAVFEKMFRSMRGYTQYNDAQAPRPETAAPNDRWRLKCYGVNTAGNSATNGLIPYVQKAATTKSAAILSWHALGSTDTKFAVDGGVLTSFEALLAWADVNRSTIEVATMDTFNRRMAAAW